MTPKYGHTVSTRYAASNTCKPVTSRVVYVRVTRLPVIILVCLSPLVEDPYEQSHTGSTAGSVKIHIGREVVTIGIVAVSVKNVAINIGRNIKRIAGTETNVVGV